MAHTPHNDSLLKEQNHETLPVLLREALSERYLSYALSTIMSRSLPDVRDGLKPVQRRLLHAMRLLKLDPKAGYKKSARIVGDVIGKFHPHGDTAIYEALVRLAQDFAQRYPLIDGQGNFGNIDGDNAAAMRYTESRMTAVAQALLEGIEQDAVDFRNTYDGEDEEPIVLPAAFPNLLANGAQGIAVGMATSIPPHHVGELAKALTYLIDHPDTGTHELVNFVAGPDFPTGGQLVESRESIIQAYETGRGSFRIRCTWDVETFKGGAWQVVVREIPYQTQKSRLIEKLAELITTKRASLLADVRDESAEDIRLILEPRSRNVDPALMMEQLFKLSELENKFSLNLNVLTADNTPRVLSLKEALQAFLDHRRVVLQRRTQYRLTQIERRLDILEGYLIVYLNIDEVIRIIRFEDHPKSELITKFSLLDVQAEAILNLRLRALHKLEEIEIRRELDELRNEQIDLQNLLDSETRQWQTIASQISEIGKNFGEGIASKRRTKICDAVKNIEMSTEDFIEKEPLTLILSKRGWIRTMKGHNVEPSSVKYKDGDDANIILPLYTTDKVILLARSGRAFTLACDKLPGGRGFGEPLSLIIEIDFNDPLVDVRIAKEGLNLVLASSDGRGFIIEQDAMLASTKSGKVVMSPAQGEGVQVVTPLEGDSLAVVGENRKLLVFPLKDLPTMSKGKGVILQKYRDGGLADIKSFNLEQGLSWRLGEKTRTEKTLVPWQGKRGSAGRMVPNGFPRSGLFKG